MVDKNDISVAPFPERVARALSNNGKHLLESPNLAGAVNQLEPLEAYFLVKELGLEDSTSILLNASKTQIQTFIDLDCWDKNKPEPLDIAAWLAPFAALGTEALSLAFQTLDFELQVLYFTHLVDIYDVLPDGEPSGSGKKVPTKVTTDGFFHLEVRNPDAEGEIDPFCLVDAIYLAGVDKAFQLITAAKWESHSVLEEQAHRFRAGRLEDLGFPTIDRAVRIFAPPPSKPTSSFLSNKNHPETVTLPALYAKPLRNPTLLSRALNTIGDTQLLSTLETNLIQLTNAAVIAYGESPRDLNHTQLIAQRVVHTLSLGLEILLSTNSPFDCYDDSEAFHDAGLLFNQWPLQDIFRHGYHASTKLRNEARLMVSDPVVKSWLEKYTPTDDYSQDRLDREFIKALCKLRPLFGGWNPLKPEEVRAFATKLELEQAESRLIQIGEKLI